MKKVINITKLIYAAIIGIITIILATLFYIVEEFGITTGERCSNLVSTLQNEMVSVINELYD